MNFCRLNRATALFAMGLGLLIPAAASAQGTLTTILTNGPTAKRINLVVLAEGYTTNQAGQFLVDATNAVNNLLAQQQYLEYKSYFNAFAIFVTSVDSGSDHPISGTYKNTYFNSSYDSYGIEQLITIPPNDRDTNYNNGQGKVDALLTALMPEYDLVMMVVNDLLYGGSGGQTFITSLNTDSAEVVRHESGHSLGGLADEYAYGAPAGYQQDENYPNSTAQTNRASIKWTTWILGATPVPTPDVSSNYATVGLFEGAQYQTTGWYRPRHDCKMRSIVSGTTIPFCEICSEQLVKSIYTLIRPIDVFLPAATNFAIYSTQAAAFSVTPLQPLTHNLTVQWFTNNTPVTGASNPVFTLAPKSLGNGTHTLRAVVSDPTTFVRTDPGNLLKQTNTWTLNLSLNELALISAQYLTSNRFRLTVTGTAPQGFVIQGSTNLVNWTSLATNSLTGGKFDYTNASLTNLTRRYYRTLSPP